MTICDFYKIGRETGRLTNALYCVLLRLELYYFVFDYKSKNIQNSALVCLRYVPAHKFKTVSPISYDHPLVQEFWPLMTSGRKMRDHFSMNGRVGTLNCGYK